MIRTLLACFIFILFSATNAHACKCYPANNELGEQTYLDADIIIYAKVINPSKGFTQAGPILTVETMDIIKGDDIPKILNMNYNPTITACGNHFSVDEEAILAIYDTRELASTMTQGYGFRLMSSCQQDYVRHHIQDNNYIYENQLFDTKDRKK